MAIKRKIKDKNEKEKKLFILVYTVTIECQK